MRKCTRKVDGMIYSFHQWVVINDELFGVIEDDEGNVFPCLFNQIKFVKSEVEDKSLITYTPQEYLKEFNEGKYKYIAMDEDFTWVMYGDRPHILTSPNMGQWGYDGDDFIELDELSKQGVLIKSNGNWMNSLHSLG